MMCLHTAIHASHRLFCKRHVCTLHSSPYIKMCSVPYCEHQHVAVAEDTDIAS